MKLQNIGSRIDMQSRPMPAAAADGRSSTRHQQLCDLGGFRNRVILTFDLLTSGSTHTERLI